MADKKISQLTSASTPLAGTEVLPIVQSGSTVKVSSDDLTVKNVRSNATTGILQVAGPGAGTTRVMTTPNANFTAARTDAAQTFTGTQTFSGTLVNRTATGGNFVLDSTVAGQQNTITGLVDNGNLFGTINYVGFEHAFKYGSTELFRAKSDGNVAIANGNLQISTAAKGIDFSANSHAAGMTSELLNWYEEGTWTPEYAPETGAFTSVTYGFNTARYVRIGSMVWVTWSMRTSALTVGTASGTLYIKNLPFTSRNASPGAFGVLGTSVDFNANNPFAGAVAANDNKITLYRGQNNVVNLVSDLSTGGANNFTAGVICYQA